MFESCSAQVMRRVKRRSLRRSKWARRRKCNIARNVSPSLDGRQRRLRRIARVLEGTLVPEN